MPIKHTATVICSYTMFLYSVPQNIKSNDSFMHILNISTIPGQQDLEQFQHTGHKQFHLV